MDLRMTRSFGKVISEWCGGAAIFRVSGNLISEWCCYSETGFANEMASRKSNFRMVRRRRTILRIELFEFLKTDI